MGAIYCLKTTHYPLCLALFFASGLRKLEPYLCLSLLCIHLCCGHRKCWEKPSKTFLFCAQNLYSAHYITFLLPPKTTTRRTYVLGFYLLLAFKLKIRLFSSLHISAVDFKTRIRRLMSAFFCASKSPTNTKVWLFPGSPENIYGYVSRLVSFLT